MSRKEFNAAAKPVKYADADARLRAKMDKVIAPIAANPTDFDAVMDYGNDDALRLGEAATELLRAKMAIDRLTDKVETVITLRNEGFVNVNAEKFAELGREIDRQLEKLRKDTRNAHSALNVKIGAADEVARRYREVYPATTLEGVEAALYKSIIEKRSGQFAQSVMRLEETRDSLLNLDSNIDLLKDTASRIIGTVTGGVEEKLVKAANAIHEASKLPAKPARTPKRKK